jgi:hypothetical protein
MNIGKERIGKDCKGRKGRRGEEYNIIIYNSICIII